MPYEEISDISHCVPQVSFFEVADYVAYQDSLACFRRTLGREDRLKLEKVIAWGNVLKGRKPLKKHWTVISQIFETIRKDQRILVFCLLFCPEEGFVKCSNGLLFRVLFV